MCCDLLRLLVWKITKRIHSSKPASLNRPIGKSWSELWTLTERGDSTGWQAVNLRQMEWRRSDSEAPLYNYWSSHCPCPIPVPYLSRTPDLRMPLSWNLMCWYSGLPLRGNTSPWHWKHAAVLVCTGSTSSSVQTSNLTHQVILCWLHAWHWIIYKPHTFSPCQTRTHAHTQSHTLDGRMIALH